MRIFRSRISVIFYYLGVAFVILGFLLGLIISFKVGKFYMSISDESGFGIGISIFLIIFLGNSFTGACLIAISELLEALEISCNNIVQMNDNMESILKKISSNTDINASTNSDKSSNSRLLTNQAKSEPKKGWICMSCGKRNDMSADYCSCGKPKNNAVTFGQ